MCTLVIPKSVLGVPVLSSKSIGPPSVLVSCKYFPVLALVLNGSPVTLASPPKGTLLLASLVTLVIVTALPFASVSFSLPSPNTSTVMLGMFNASIVSLMSVLFAIRTPYCALPLGTAIYISRIYSTATAYVCTKWDITT